MSDDSQKAPVTVKEYIVQLEARFDGFESRIVKHYDKENLEEYKIQEII